jgi:hypothetical protein
MKRPNVLSSNNRKHVPGVLIVLGILLCSAECVRAASSAWAHYDSKHELIYQTTERGDRIMDFSSAGYMGGGVALPTVAVKETVAPSGLEDDSAAIQKAIDSVSKLEPANGSRGAVLLKPGSYNCSRPLEIQASGVVLRGSGSESNGTVLLMSGNPHVCISMAGRVKVERIGSPRKFADAYVPSGASEIRLVDVVGLKVGDTLQIARPVTADWIQFMGMDTLVRNDKKQTWVSAGSELLTERTVTKLKGARVTLDAPLTDSFDAKFLGPAGATATKCEISGRISQVGVENLRIVAPPQSVTISERHHSAIRMNGACDAWVRDLVIEDTVDSIGLGSGSKRVTVQKIDLRHSVPTKGAAKPADLSASGTQILFDRCTGAGDNIFYFVTGPRVTGPIVLLNCVFHGNGHIQPHARWATGLLVDNCQVPESGIDFMNRGEMGSGHGWTIGWAVAWNCSAKNFVIQNPPGVLNWAIGCKGSREQLAMPFNHEPKLNQGEFDSHGAPVEPESLYLAQLRERKGAGAVTAISYNP